VGLIHARCLTMRDGIYDDAAAVTHMSSDANNVENLSWIIQELWAQIIEILIGMALLSNQLGWWCLTPLIIVLCKVTPAFAPQGWYAYFGTYSNFQSFIVDGKQGREIDWRLAESKTETNRPNDINDRLY
jgi:hypothetical protein